jgi:hypothetical protein
MVEMSTPTSLDQSAGRILGERRGVLVRTWQLLNKPQWVIVLGANTIIAALFLRDIPVGSGMMVYGNLPAFYYYGPPNHLWLINLNLFNLIAQFLSYSVGPFAAQTAVFLLSIFLPSFGILFLMNRLPISKPIGVAVAIAIGTPLNPLLFLSFLGGAFTVFLWLFLVCLSLGLIIEARRSEIFRRRTFFVLAGITFGLSLTATNFIPAGAYVSFPLVVGALVLTPEVSPPFGTRFRALAVDVTLFIVPAVGILLPLALGDTLQLGPLASGSGPLGGVNAFIMSTIGFEFAPYSAGYALLNGVWLGVNDLLTNPAWYILVGIGVTGGIGILFSKGGPWRPLYRFCAMEYLLATSLILLLHTGSGTQWLLATRVFDSLDYPAFFLFIQQLSLLFILPATLTFVVKRVVILRGRTAHGTFAAIGIRPPPGASVPNRDIPNSRKSWPLNSRTQLLPVAAATLVIVLACSNSGGFIVNANSYLTQDQGNVFVPTYYSEIHDWYAKDASGSTGQILILPNDYSALNDVSGFIPSSKIWNAPIGLPPLNSGENITLYRYVLSTLYSGNTLAFGTLLARSGVQSIVLLSDQSQITVVPAQEPYNAYSPLSMPLANLTSVLNNSGAFSNTYSSKHFAVYSNNAYLGLSKTTTSTTAFVSTPPRTLSLTNLLNSSSYAGYGSYPAQDVSRNGQNYSLQVIANSAIPFSLLFFSQPVQGLSTSNPYVSAELSIAASFRVPANLILYSFVLFYNSSTAGFWSEFSRTNLGSYTTNGSMNAPVLVPTGAIRANVVFYASTLSNTSGTIAVNIPQLLLNLTTVDLARSSLQSNISDSLIQDHVIAPNSLLLPYPLFSQSQQDLELQTVLISVGPLPLVDPSLSLNFSIIPSRMTTYNFTQGYGTTTFIAAFAPGISDSLRVSTSGKSATLSSNGSSTQEFEFVPLGSLSPSSSLDISLNSTVGVVLLGVVTEQIPDHSGAFSLALPNGQIEARYVGTLTQWSIVVASQGVGPTLSPFLAFIPIFTVGGCVFWLIRGRARARGSG